MKLIITAFAALASVVSATMDYTCDISVNFSSKNVVTPVNPSFAWATDIATNEGYDIKLEENSFKNFVVAHSAAGVRGGNRQLSSAFDYEATGVGNIVCRWCGHPEDDRRLAESDELAQELVKTDEFQKFEKALCDAIISKGDYQGASGCRVAIDKCDEGTGLTNSGSSIQSYFVKDMRGEPQDGVVFVLENGN